MPIILPSSAYETWLDPLVAPERLEALLVPYPAEVRMAQLRRRP